MAAAAAAFDSLIIIPLVFTGIVRVGGVHKGYCDGAAFGLTRVNTCSKRHPHTFGDAGGARDTPAAMANTERTYIMIKPDGVMRGLIGTIIQRFEQRGFVLRGLKMVSVERAHAEKHYEDLSSKPFFAGLVDYIISAPVCAMVWEGKDVVKTGRKIIGATNPLASEPGTIRGDFCIDVGRNVIHGSDAVESAQKEIALWFPEGVCEYTHAMNAWVYE